MALISEDDRRYLTNLFGERLVNPVRLRFYTQWASALTVPGQVCATCRDTQQLLEELVALSDKLRLEIHDFYEEQQQARSEGIAEIPAVLLNHVVEDIVG